MKKLKLNKLEVQSFNTDKQKSKLGTVKGYHTDGQFCITEVQEICDETMFDGYTCAYTCDPRHYDCK
ncbi:MAG: hypothetical protein ACEPO8_11315 [Rhodothermaceae bacterium]